MKAFEQTSNSTKCILFSGLVATCKTHESIIYVKQLADIFMQNVLFSDSFKILL